jgi:HEAT repeat protein
MTLCLNCSGSDTFRGKAPSSFVHLFGKRGRFQILRYTASWNAMRIEFCSLCDESVPLPDLDQGIAVKTKGRTICANCESAMSAPELPARQAALALLGSEPVAGMLTSSGGDTTVMEPMKSPGKPSSARSSAVGTSTGGMLFGLFSLLVIAALVVGFKLYDQFESKRLADSKELASLSRLVEQKAAVQDRRMRAAIDEVTDKFPGMQATTARLDQEMIDLGAAHGKSILALRSELELIKKKVSGLNVLLERMDGNEAALSSVALSMTDVVSDLLALNRRLDSAEAIAAAMPLDDGNLGAADVERVAPWAVQLPGLADLDSATRWLAVTAIGEFDDPECAPHLIPRLKDEDVFVRMAAARILGEVRALSAIEALIDTLEDEKPIVRQSSMLALRSLTGESLKFDPDAKAAQRSKRVKAWRDWWKKNKSKYEKV